MRSFLFFNVADNSETCDLKWINLVPQCVPMNYNIKQNGFKNSTAFTLIKTTQAWSTMCYLLWEPDENCLGPGNPGAFEFNDGSNYPSAPPSGGEGIGPLHSKNGGNILAMDGHVQYILTKQFTADSNTPLGQGPGPGGKTYLWWSPSSSDGH
jgi:prepilin-type processing-associated H-X9-DG protein